MSPFRRVGELTPRLAVALGAVAISSDAAFARLPLAVPEPSTMTVIGGAIAGLIAVYRMRGK